MQCPRCQHENPPQAKFCLECGTRVALTCTKCRSELPAGAKFCLECGGGIQRSENGGRTWTLLDKGLAPGVVGTRLLFPLQPSSGHEIFLGTYRGVWHSSDGGLLWTRAGNMDEAVLALATFHPRAPLPPKRKKK
jgi:ribosomal protein L40E